jgi:hypothetical protein
MFPSDIELDQYQAGMTVILLTVVLAVMGQILARRFLDREKIAGCHEVGGYFFTIVGSLYAVLLGLIVVDAMSKFEDAKRVVEQEANSSMEIHAMAWQMPKHAGEKIRSLVEHYVDEVVTREWNLMENNQNSLEARNLVFELINVVGRIEPVTENQKAIYPMLVQETNSLWESRRARTNFSDYDIPVVEWIILGTGGFIVVLFTYFFTIDNPLAHLLMTGMVCLIVCMNIYLLLLFGSPFSGAMKVSTVSFEVAREYMTKYGNPAE